MSQPRWRRLLPDSSQLWLLAAVLVVVVFGVSFFSLAGEKSQALAKERGVQEQLQTLQEQNRLLRQAQAEAERGDNVDVQARRYFGYSNPGETRVIAPPARSMPKPPPAVPDGPVAQEPPWAGWWQQLQQLLPALTNDGN